MPPGGWQQPVARTAGLPAGVAPASWGRRVGATLLDGLILLLALIVLVAPGGVIAITNNGGGLGFGLLGLGYIVWLAFAYLVYGPSLLQRDSKRNGQTLGKQWVGIRVIRIDGQPCGWGTGLLREFVIKALLFGFVGGFLVIPPLLDVLWPLWDDENRALHDMLASTRVVRA